MSEWFGYRPGQCCVEERLLPMQRPPPPPPPPPPHVGDGSKGTAGTIAVWHQRRGKSCQNEVEYNDGTTLGTPTPDFFSLRLLLLSSSPARFFFVLSFTDI